MTPEEQIKQLTVKIYELELKARPTQRMIALCTCCDGSGSTQELTDYHKHVYRDVPCAKCDGKGRLMFLTRTWTEKLP